MNNKIDFASKRKRVTVYVPELEADINLRALSNGQFSELKAASKEDSLVGQLARAIVDDAGQRIYVTDEDISILEEMSLSVAKFLIDALNDLHGVSAKAVAAIEKK